MTTPLIAIQRNRFLQHRKPYTWALIIGIACLLVLTDANTNILGLPFATSIHADGQMLLWGVGVGAIIYGFGGRIGRVGRTDAYILLALGLGALILRLIGIESYLRALVDELNTISGIITLWDRPEQRLLWAMSENIMPYPYHYVWLHEQAVILFGRSVFGLRIFDALMGAGSVMAVYGMVRTLATRRAAFIAGLVLMSLPLHLHITRLALINGTDALLLPLLIWALALALRGRGTLAQNRSAWIWAGVWLALLQYFYEGGRLLSIPLVIGWLAMFALTGRIRRRDLRGMGWLALTFSILVFPLVVTWATSGAPAAGRLGITGGDGGYWASVLGARLGDGWLEVLASQVFRSLAVYLFLPDQSPFYMGDTAMLLPFVAPFAIMGVFASLWWRARLRIVLLLWVAGIALANGLFLLNSAVYSRFIGATPALAALVGLGLEGWYLLMRHIVRRSHASARASGTPARSARWSKRRAQFLLWSVVSLLVFGQGAYFFVAHLPMYNTEYRLTRPYPDVDDAILRAGYNVPIGTQVHLVMPHTPSTDEDLDMVWAMIGAGQAYGREFMRLLRDDVRTVTVPSSQLVGYMQGLTAGGHAFFIAPNDEASALAIISEFPQHTVLYTTDPRIPASQAMILYYVPTGRTLVENPQPPTPSPISLR